MNFFFFFFLPTFFFFQPNGQNFPKKKKRKSRKTRCLYWTLHLHQIFTTTCAWPTNWCRLNPRRTVTSAKQCACGHAKRRREQPYERTNGPRKLISRPPTRVTSEFLEFSMLAFTLARLLASLPDIVEACATCPRAHNIVLPAHHANLIAARPQRLLEFIFVLAVLATASRAPLIDTFSPIPQSLIQTTATIARTTTHNETHSGHIRAFDLRRFFLFNPKKKKKKKKNRTRIRKR
jgi:hypothetical protein